jgi:hypothetical protein
MKPAILLLILVFEVCVHLHLLILSKLTSFLFQTTQVTVTGIIEGAGKEAAGIIGTAMGDAMSKLQASEKDESLDF